MLVALHGGGGVLPAVELAEEEDGFGVGLGEGELLRHGVGAQGEGAEEDAGNEGSSEAGGTHRREHTVGGSLWRLLVLRRGRQSRGRWREHRNGAAWRAPLLEAASAWAIREERDCAARGES